jgi:hypothetical protein
MASQSSSSSGLPYFAPPRLRFFPQFHTPERLTANKPSDVAQSPFLMPSPRRTGSSP